MKKTEESIYEEFKELSLGRTWLIVVLLCLFLVLSGLYVHRMLPDKPRTWNYGALDTIPGQSVYSTTSSVSIAVGPAETKKVEQQLETLPGAQPLEKLKPQGYEQGVKP